MFLYLYTEIFMKTYFAFINPNAPTVHTYESGMKELIKQIHSIRNPLDDL